MRSILCVAGLAVLAGLSIALAGTSEQVRAVSRTQTAIGRLQAADGQTRRAAKAEILEIYKELSASLKQGRQVSDLPEYQQLVDGLISIVSKQREKYQDLFDEKLLTVELLGDLRATEAVEVLLDNILFCPPQIVTERTPAVLYPCVGALVKIGKPSVDGILKRLDRRWDETGVIRLYAIVIRRVEEREPGKALLERELEKARTRQANLADMLPYFAGTMSDVARMLSDPDPQVRFAAARHYARMKGWGEAAALSTPQGREQFVADTLARIEREGGVQGGGPGTAPQPQPKPDQPPALAE